MESACEFLLYKVYGERNVMSVERRDVVKELDRGWKRWWSEKGYQHEKRDLGESEGKKEHGGE